MELFLSISLAAVLYLLVLWIALTTPPRPPQLRNPALHAEWDPIAFRIRKGMERVRRGWHGHGR